MTPSTEQQLRQLPVKLKPLLDAGLDSVWARTNYAYEGTPYSAALGVTELAIKIAEAIARNSKRYVAWHKLTTGADL